MFQYKLDLLDGIRSNIFWSDDPEEDRRFLEMGMDCILTNDYQRIRAENVIDLKKIAYNRKER